MYPPPMPRSPEYSFDYSDDEGEERVQEEVASDISEGEGSQPSVGDSGSDTDEEDLTPERLTFTRATTASKRTLLTPEATHEKVCQVLATMDSLGLDLPILLDAVSWGNPHCVTDHHLKCCNEAGGWAACRIQEEELCTTSSLKTSKQRRVAL